jgi:hypothetical protein
VREWGWELVQNAKRMDRTPALTTTLTPQPVALISRLGNHNRGTDRNREGGFTGKRQPTASLQGLK